MPSSVAAPADSALTIHLSAAGEIHAGLIRTLVAVPGSRVTRALTLPGVGKRESGVGKALVERTSAETSETLTRLVWLCGWGALDDASLEIAPSIELTAEDHTAAQALGGAIRPAAGAELDDEDERASAWVGPALVPFSEPLASIDGALTGIRLDLRRCETVEGRAPAPLFVAPSPARWLLRVTFPGIVPSDATVRHLVSNAGLGVERIEGSSFSTTTRWAIAGVHSRVEVDAALTGLSRAHRLTTTFIRSL